jgi:hypothetical protein
MTLNFASILHLQTAFGQARGPLIESLTDFINNYKHMRAVSIVDRYRTPLGFESGSILEWNSDMPYNGSTNTAEPGRCAAFNFNPSSGTFHLPDGTLQRMTVIDSNSIIDPVYNETVRAGPDGNKALRVIVYPQDNINIPDIQRQEYLDRAEINYCTPDNTRYIFDEGDDVWFHWYTLFPSSFETFCGGLHTFTQLHQPGGETKCSPSPEKLETCSEVPFLFEVRHYPSPPDRVKIAFRAFNIDTEPQPTGDRFPEIKL